MQLCQVALSGRASLDVTASWYRDGLGFIAAGGASFAGPDIAEVQGIDAALVDINLMWLVDRSDFMQLELFRYNAPVARARRDDWSIRDVGYNLLCVHVLDFDRTLAALAGIGTSPLTAPHGVRGERRVCVHDPNSTLIELMERDVGFEGAAATARPQVNAAIRGVRATVRDLTLSRQFLVDTIGLQIAQLACHGPAHEALWGHSGRAAQTLTLTDGRSFVELADYGSATRARRSDYQICDEGILNIAIGDAQQAPYRRTRDCVANAGPYAVHRELVLRPDLEVNYVTDEQGFSVELFYMGALAQAEFGFSPLAAHTASR